jgi:hypothetical protein
MRVPVPIFRFDLNGAAEISGAALHIFQAVAAETVRRAAV